MNRRRLAPALLAVGAVLALGAATTGSNQQHADHLDAVVTVYKSPSCGCCGKWVDYLRANGFEVKTVDLDDLTEIKAASGVPLQLQTCHTAVVGGYVVEGHVPVDALEKLLKEQPKIAGIGVPGMPIGSPGMEVPGAKAQPYDVIAWDKTGKTSVYAKK